MNQNSIETGCHASGVNPKRKIQGLPLVFRLWRLSYSSKPLISASLTRPAVLRTPSFWIKCNRWDSTVLGETKSFSAISAVVCWSTMRAKTSFSLRVSLGIKDACVWLPSAEERRTFWCLLGGIAPLFAPHWWPKWAPLLRCSLANSQTHHSESCLLQ